MLPRSSLSLPALLGVVGLAAFVQLGCAASPASETDPSAIADDSPDGRESESVVGNVAVGSTLRANANVNLRSGPSTGNGVLLVVPNGSTVTAISGAPKNGFYNVRYGAKSGFSYGVYYDRVSSGPGPAPSPSGGDIGAVVTHVGNSIATYSPGTTSAIGVLFFPSGERFTYNGNLRQVSASSMKFVWAEAALWAQSKDSVNGAAVPTFTNSDNNAAGELIDLAGGASNVNSFTSGTLGIPTSEMSLCHWNFGATRNADNCSNAMGGDNFFTPNAVLTFLSHVHSHSPIGGDKGAALDYWSTLSPRSGYGGWIGTQLPGAARSSMHHKAGWLPPGCCGSDSAYNNTNDIAIIETPRGAYAVAILLSHGNDYWGRQVHALEWASCAIYHAVANDGDPYAQCKVP